MKCCIQCGKFYNNYVDKNFCSYECFKVYPEPLGAGDTNYDST